MTDATLLVAARSFLFFMSASSLNQLSIQQLDNELYQQTGFRHIPAIERGFPFPWCAKRQGSGWIIREFPPSHGLPSLLSSNADLLPPPTSFRRSHSSPPRSSGDNLVGAREIEFKGWKAAKKYLETQSTLTDRWNRQKRFRGEQIEDEKSKSRCEDRVEGNRDYLQKATNDGDSLKQESLFESTWPRTLHMGAKIPEGAIDYKIAAAQKMSTSLSTETNMTTSRSSPRPPTNPQILDAAKMLVQQYFYNTHLILERKRKLQQEKDFELFLRQRKKEARNGRSRVKNETVKIRAGMKSGPPAVSDSFCNANINDRETELSDADTHFLLSNKAGIQQPTENFSPPSPSNQPQLSSHAPQTLQHIQPKSKLRKKSHPVHIRQLHAINNDFFEDSSDVFNYSNPHHRKPLTHTVPESLSVRVTSRSTSVETSITIGEDPELDRMIEDIVNECTRKGGRTSMVEFDGSAVEVLREVAKEAAREMTYETAGGGDNTAISFCLDGVGSVIHKSNADAPKVEGEASINSKRPATYDNDDMIADDNISVSHMIEELVGELSQDARVAFDRSAVEVLKDAAGAHYFLQSMRSVNKNDC